MIKYNCKEPFPNASVVSEREGRKDLKQILKPLDKLKVERGFVCVCVNSLGRKIEVLQDSETRQTNKNPIYSFQSEAGFHMLTQSWEALLADKGGCGSGAEPSHSDD